MSVTTSSRPERQSPNHDPQCPLGHERSLVLTPLSAGTSSRRRDLEPRIYLGQVLAPEIHVAPTAPHPGIPQNLPEPSLLPQGHCVSPEPPSARKPWGQLCPPNPGTWITDSPGHFPLPSPSSAQPRGLRDPPWPPRIFCGAGDTPRLLTGASRGAAGHHSRTSSTCSATGGWGERQG